MFSHTAVPCLTGEEEEKKMKKAILLLSLASLYPSAYAEDFTDTARVISSKPIYERVNQPRRECWNETVQGAAASGERSYGGAIIGGIAGGVIGSQVGGGNGRIAATAAGTLAGAMIGDNMANQGQQQQARSQVVERCRDIDNVREVITGYSVTYSYNGRRATTTLPYDPGRTIHVSVSAVEESGGGNRYMDNRRYDNRRYDD